MAFHQEQASFTVEETEGAWTVEIRDSGCGETRRFATRDEADDFAHAQRLRLGIVPQQDVS